MNAALTIASAVHTSRQANIAAIRREHAAEERRIRDSAKSERKKAKELEELEKRKSALEEEAAKRQLRFTAITGAANTALAIQAQIVAILNTTRDTPGGLFTRIGAGLAMAGVTAKYISEVKAAQAAIPKREHGGGVRANQLVQVAERDKPELFKSGADTFMISPQGGTVEPIADGGMKAPVNITNNFYLQDVDELEARGPEIMARSLEQADRAGAIDYGALPGFQRAIGGR